MLSPFMVATGMADAASLKAKVVDADGGRALGGHIWVTLGREGWKIGDYKGTGLWHGERCKYASFGREGFTLELPDETCRVWVERGREYLPEIMQFDGGETGTVERTVRLRRFIDMNERGWWSSDLHIHRGPQRTSQQILREDVNVAFPLTWWNGPRFTDELNAWAAKSKDGRTVAIDDTHIMSLYNMEFETQPQGAVFLLHLKHLIEGEVPPVEKVCLAGLEAGGFVNAAKPLWKCSVESVILGKAGMIEVVNNHYLWPAALNNEAWGFERDFAPEWHTYTKDFIGYAHYNCDITYALMNCGYRLTVVGGTADGVLGTHIGHNRTYVYTGKKKLDLDGWLAALAAGRTFATNGPMLFVKVDGQLPGSEIKVAKGKSLDAKVAIDIESPDPIEIVEIIHNGDVVSRVEPPRRGDRPYRYRSEQNVKVDESGWIAVRVFARIRPDNVALAHSTPVWIDVGDEPIIPKAADTDAMIKRVDWWIDWTKEKKPAATETYDRLKKILLTHRQRAR